MMILSLNLSITGALRSYHHSGLGCSLAHLLPNLRMFDASYHFVPFPTMFRSWFGYSSFKYLRDDAIFDERPFDSMPPHSAETAETGQH